MADAVGVVWAYSAHVITGGGTAVAMGAALTAQEFTSARIANLDRLDATVSSRSTLDAIGVWTYGVRTLPSWGTLVATV